MKYLGQQKPANTSPDMVPPDVYITLTVNGRPLKFPWRLTRLAVFHNLPDWMRDSSAKPPPPEKGDKSGLGPDVMVGIRSAFKAMARPFLPKLLHGLYGDNVRMPAMREDTLPMLVFMLIDFVLLQTFQHPLDVTYDETTGIVTGVRPGQRIVPASDAGESDGRTGQTGDHRAD